jgi:hypothetical protein
MIMINIMVGMGDCSALELVLAHMFTIYLLLYAYGMLK